MTEENTDNGLKDGQVVDALPIHKERCKLAEQRNMVWAADIESHIHPDALEKSSFWTNRSSEMNPGDEIKCWWDDGSRWSHYLVTSCSAATGAKLRLIKTIVLDKPNKIVSQTEHYKLEHKGRVKKWCIIRKADNVTVADEIENKRDALQLARQLDGQE